MSKKGKLQSSYFSFSKKNLLNKYVIVTAAFFVWVMFFDKSSFPANYRLGRNIDRLEETKVEYENRIVDAKMVKEDIDKNREKYAREKYLMHKENEDVIVIQKK